MNTLYYTLGNSDILVVSDEVKEYQRFADFRETTRKLYENLKSYNYRFNEKGIVFEKVIDVEIIEPVSRKKEEVSAKAMEFPILQVMKRC